MRNTTIVTKEALQKARFRSNNEVLIGETTYRYESGLKMIEDIRINAYPDEESFQLEDYLDMQEYIPGQNDELQTPEEAFAEALECLINEDEGHKNSTEAPCMIWDLYNMEDALQQAIATGNGDADDEFAKFVAPLNDTALFVLCGEAKAMELYKQFFDVVAPLLRK